MELLIYLILNLSPQSKDTEDVSVNLEKFKNKQCAQVITRKSSLLNKILGTVWGQWGIYGGVF